jgi:four helix bundle protein
MEIFQIPKKFLPEEKYSRVDQIRRSSHSVCMNIAEAWRKRRYKAAFVVKLSDAETEACETEVHIQFSLACQYVDQKTALLEERYEQILSQLVIMIGNPEQWLIRMKKRIEETVKRGNGEGENRELLPFPDSPCLRFTLCSQRSLTCSSLFRMIFPMIDGAVG